MLHIWPYMSLPAHRTLKFLLFTYVPKLTVHVPPVCLSITEAARKLICRPNQPTRLWQNETPIQVNLSLIGTVWESFLGGVFEIHRTSCVIHSQSK